MVHAYTSKQNNGERHRTKSKQTFQLFDVVAQIWYFLSTQFEIGRLSIGLLMLRRICVICIFKCSSVSKVTPLIERNYVHVLSFWLGLAIKMPNNFEHCSPHCILA